MPRITCAAEHALPHASHPPAAFDLPGAQRLQILPSDQQSLRPLWLGRPRFLEVVSALGSWVPS